MPKYLPIGLSIAIFLIFCVTLFSSTVNIPSFDDYDTTLGFIKRIFFDDYTAKGKFEILFGRHNEHRIVFSRLAAAAYFSIFHRVDFANLVFFQNLLLICFFILMLKIMDQNRLLSGESLLFVTVFLFSLGFWQVTFFYWGGIQHYTVFFFCFLSLYLLDKSDRIISASYFMAILAVVIAVFSFGNGFLGLLLGAFLLFVQKKWPQLIAWSIITAVLLWITFAVRSQALAKQHVQFNFDWAKSLLLTFLGSFVYINPASNHYINIYFCMIVGTTVLFVWVWLFFMGYARQNPLLYCLLSMPVLTGIIISISRFESRAAGGIAPRYMFFTATIPVILMLIFLDMKILRTRHLRILSYAGVVLWGTVFFNNRKALQDMNKDLTARVVSWQNDPETRLVYYHEAKPYSEAMQWAVDHRVVRIPDLHEFRETESEQK
ncbi:hypothetical protein MUK70_23215 [Dyadobacter chenwenxiniae]|uniref:Uncharacterized protein n=1 Tax=Dyadobacter chenwenxiniae TaxID=2906456 RepID=A0A9X1TEZ9_9BACT|nr:hypothetical protein [Dyadobacter chenwenxiniae]MCF0062154.1 hypothetical protein [Dyadobacter chenwenxiniae]UON81958.1 hypothetical protein MUK70_23215 [Dyadobacter chenwenxiniae]